ncbi:alcohol dehydrogenase [Podospora didyma]|uniref:Alcohol dehydrogenase n=1 Tax=Podospora didyma TaxID=330526 RepID=A0AAE0KJ79_9PEZI|nr:alcohol dehydrogenase [Podospora didyma]
MAASPLPTTYRSFRRTAGIATQDSPLSIEPATEPTPSSSSLGAHDVLLRTHAVSLNFRDVAMLHGRYPMPVASRGVPTSDCAAEVIAVGSAVTKFQVGDRVSPVIGLKYLTGEEEGSIFEQLLGGDIDGVLREYAVFEDRVLVRLPGHLSYEEASTIPIAGLTAWTALKSGTLFDKKKSALLQGTGGVSMFALLLSLAGGITPIITSSSDEKLAAIKKLGPAGAVLGYNYKTNPDQSAAVKALVPRGVDVVINNRGPPSIPQDIDALTNAGTVSLVGFLEGVTADWDPSVLLGLIGKNANIVGIACGTKIDFENVNKFIEEKKIRLEPLIDRVFAFDDSKAAFEYLYSGKHVGKVVIKL